MDIIVVGVGRMGRALAQRLDKQGHKVCAVDRDPDALERLGDSFMGARIQGVGFDRGVLERAGIDRVSAVVACTSSDEANITIAHMARNVFRVPRVIARLYDTAKADTYRRLDIQTVSTTSWGVTRMCELLTYEQLDNVFEFGSGEVRLVRADVPAALVGSTVRELTAVSEVQVVSISRDSSTFIPTLGTRLEDGDVLYAAVTASAAAKFKAMLGLER